jgi:hypothetical protein
VINSNIIANPIPEIEFVSFVKLRDIKPGNIMKLGQETVSASSNMQRSVSNMSDSTFSFANGSFTNRLGGQTTVNSTLTGSIEFVNSSVLRNPNRRISIASSPTASVDYLESSYKLIDLGTAVAIHEEEDTQPAETMKTVTEMAFAG